MTSVENETGRIRVPDELLQEAQLQFYVSHVTECGGLVMRII